MAPHTIIAIVIMCVVYSASLMVPCPSIKNEEGDARISVIAFSVLKQKRQLLLGQLSKYNNMYFKPYCIVKYLVHIR